MHRAEFGVPALGRVSTTPETRFWGIEFELQNRGSFRFDFGCHRFRSSDFRAGEDRSHSRGLRGRSRKAGRADALPGRNTAIGKDRQSTAEGRSETN